MDLDDLRFRLQAAREEAERGAGYYRDAARGRDASPEDRARAREAERIVQFAAEAARVLPPDEVERRVRMLRDWGDGRRNVAVAEATALLRGGRASDIQEAIEVAINAAGAELEAQKHEVEVWLAEHALAAWTEAGESLAALAEADDLRLLPFHAGQ